VRQYDQTDCGPAALLSILKHYGGDASLVKVRELCGTNTKGTSLYDLQNAARALGFQAQGLSGEYNDLICLKTPFIAHIVQPDGRFHFVVVFTVTPAKITIGDPGFGIKQLSPSNFQRLWASRTVLALQPDDVLFHSPPPTWIGRLSPFLRTHKAWIIQILFLGLLLTSLGLTTALYIQWVIDVLIPRGEVDLIVMSAIALLGVMVFRTGLAFFRERFILHLSKQINLEINSSFLIKVFQLPKSFFDSHRTGDLTSRIQDGERIQYAILHVTQSAILDLFLLIGSTILMWHYSSFLASLALLMMPMCALLIGQQIRKLSQQQNNVLVRHSQVESSYIDSLKGITDILGFNAQSHIVKRNQELVGEYQGAIETFGISKAWLSGVISLQSSVLTMGFLGLGSVMVIRGDLQLGQLMAIYTLLTHMLTSIIQLMGTWIHLQYAKQAARRLSDILLAQEEGDPGKRLFVLKERIGIKDAGFSWPNHFRLFDRLTLDVHKGRITSLWGPSGSGKSTLVALLQRHYHLEKGQIWVDDEQSENIDLKSYRREVAVVPQQIRVFDMSLADNIHLGRTLGNSQLLTLIHDIGLKSFLQRFSAGLKTPLGADGQDLSGGEKQILGLLRALYDRPAVLILDEGTNALDSDMEIRVFEILRNYAADHAVLLVTHNPAAVLRTDYLYILKDGKIIEQGVPHYLMRKRKSIMSQSIFWSGLQPQKAVNEPKSAFDQEK